MSDINNISLSGRLTSDSQVTTKDSFNIINFSIASDYFDKKSNESKANFINCVYFRKTIKIAEYLKKGCQVFINGSLRIESFTDKDGTKRQATKIYVTNLVPIFKQKDNNNNVDEYDYSNSEECPF